MSTGVPATDSGSPCRGVDFPESRWGQGQWGVGVDGVGTYRLQLSLLEDPGEDEAAQRDGHDQDEGEGQRRLRGLHHPQAHDARQLDEREHVHTPRLHLGGGGGTHSTGHTLGVSTESYAHGARARRPTQTCAEIHTHRYKDTHIHGQA